jgi:hypothetical protein
VALKNPYATSRKRSTEAPPDSMKKGVNNQDLADIVLGRPTQRQKQQEQDEGVGTISTRQELLQDPFSRKYRSRIYRDRLQFGCTLEIHTNADTNNTEMPIVPAGATEECLDGDTAAGAVSSETTFEQSSTPNTDSMPATCHESCLGNNVDLHDDDEDILNFVAFPLSRDLSITHSLK